MNELDQLQRILAGYDAPVIMLKALRMAATEAIAAHGTDDYNTKLEVVFDTTAQLMALECYADEVDDSVLDEDEPVSQLPETLPENVILFKQRK